MLSLDFYFLSFKKFCKFTKRSKKHSLATIAVGSFLIPLLLLATLNSISYTGTSTLEPLSFIDLFYNNLEKNEITKSIGQSNSSIDYAKLEEFNMKLNNTKVKDFETYHFRCNDCSMTIDDETSAPTIINIYPYRNKDAKFFDKSIIKFPPGYATFAYNEAMDNRASLDYKNSTFFQLRESGNKTLFLYNKLNNSYKIIYLNVEEGRVNNTFRGDEFIFLSMLMLMSFGVLINVFTDSSGSFVIVSDTLDKFIERHADRFDSEEKYELFLHEFKNKFSIESFSGNRYVYYDKKYLHIFLEQFDNYIELHSVFLFIDSFKGNIEHFKTIHDTFTKHKISYIKMLSSPSNMKEIVNFWSDSLQHHDHDIIYKYKMLLNDYRFPTTNDFLLEIMNHNRHEFSNFFIATFDFLSTRDLEVFLYNNNGGTQKVEAIYEQRVLSPMLAQVNSKKSILKI